MPVSSSLASYLSCFHHLASLVLQLVKFKSLSTGAVGLRVQVFSYIAGFFFFG